LVSKGQQDSIVERNNALDFKEDSVPYLMVDTSNVVLEENPFDFEETHHVVANDSDAVETSITEDTIAKDARVGADTVIYYIVFQKDKAEINHADSLVLNLHEVGVVDDSTGSYLDSLNLSPLARAVLKDSAYWISVAPWFSQFDSMSVNVYKIDGAKYKDTTTIELYDSIIAEGRSWSMPLLYSRITSNFGHRRYRWHYGIDLALTAGDSVLAAFDGVVRICKYNRGGFGNYIMLRHHNGLETIYGHLDKQLVKVGQHVKAGDLIGLGGSTGKSSGPHLHFEVRYQGNAIDPKSLYDFEKHIIKYRMWDITPAHFKYIRDAKAAVYHRIRSGDTLGGIAVRYRTTISRICRLNHISRNTILRIGRRLRVR